MKILFTLVALLMPTTNAWMASPPLMRRGDGLPQRHYIEALEDEAMFQALQQQQQQLDSRNKNNLMAAASAWTTAMGPFLSAQAHEVPVTVTNAEWNDMVATAVQQSILAQSTSTVADIALDPLVLSPPPETLQAASHHILVSLNEYGVASNAEMYAVIRQSYQNVVMVLSHVWAQWNALSTSEKVAVAVATVVVSYPLSYEYYKYEQERDQRLAQEKKAAMAAKKKKQAAAAKKKKEASPKDDKVVVASDNTSKEKKKAPVKKEKKEVEPVLASKGETDTPAPPKDDKEPAVPFFAEPEPIVAEVVEKPAAVEPPVVVAAVPEPVGMTPVPAVEPVEPEPPMPATTTQVSSTAGLEAYAQAYAAMMQQQQQQPPVTPVSPPTTTTNPTPTAPKEPALVTALAPRAPVASATSSYLDTLSP
eukprot:CAMPEP_0172442616 /NCGR_PEP_ID=MMETSP1065-20121228/3016_1 /TAXON_ID=265537 /ORGANISM="Amphiprora paludosa, Strain CCMP125" /LENGTH=420 /DNA_ID=CAMNT_0013192547 /DNA_START=13 /DNA_END=1275 /DNA_ORIENTATION=+